MNHQVVFSVPYVEYTVILSGCQISNRHLIVLLFLTNSQLFYFINKDSGASYWGKNLPAQRDRESTQLVPHLLSFPQMSVLYAISSNPQPQCPSVVFHVHLPIYLPDSLFLWIVFFLSTVCLLCLLTYG